MSLEEGGRVVVVARQRTSSGGSSSGGSSAQQKSDEQWLAAAEAQWRAEDAAWLREERALTSVANRMREVDSKIEQLRAITNTATLIAGFSLVVLAEMQIDPLETAEWLLTLYAVSSAVTVCLMSFAVITSTLLSVGVLKKFDIQAHETTPDQASFHAFWHATCQRDWMRAYTAYTVGILTFLVNIIFAGWVKFNDYIWPGTVVSAVCGGTIVLLFVTTHRKWGKYVSEA